MKIPVRQLVTQIRIQTAGVAFGRHHTGAAKGGSGSTSPKKCVHKKTPGCAVELNTQNCAWFGNQISLMTAMSFREAMPPEPRTRGSDRGPRWRTSVPQTPCAPTSKSWLRHCGTSLCSYRVRGLDGSCAKHLTVDFYTVVMLLTFILIIISNLVFTHPSLSF